MWFRLDVSVCDAPTDAVVRESLNLGIFMLLGVTGVAWPRDALHGVNCATLERRPAP